MPLFSSISPRASGAVLKRSVRIAGQQTSVSLETFFWRILKDIAAARAMRLNALLSEIDEVRFQDGGEDPAVPPLFGSNLSSASRIYALWWVWRQAGSVVLPASSRKGALADSEEADDGAR